MFAECLSQPNILFGAIGAGIGFLFYKGYQAFQDINFIIKAQKQEIEHLNESVDQLKEDNNKQSKQITTLKKAHNNSLHKLYDHMARQADKTEYIKDEIDNVLHLLTFRDHDNGSQDAISTDSTRSFGVNEYPYS